ncbi:FecR domain-containing protein [Luteolibacter flavescens]|uniref:FecR domain-containing protein n=1 Tax=Luteolibacter flavescens TaxID=1859460 RepID=A0ABT3FPC1_9BACT|nr:FecR domain-containing protein [Luteolibacter flavescens]MCW1885111.1 FecR domain-containing protein [Luteolibacter flavescens]
MMRPSETLRLIHELIDGSIGKEDFARLQEALLQDPAARRDYYALVCTDQMLADTYDMPEYLAAHAKVVAAPEVKRRKVSKMLVAMAAVLMAGIFTALVIQANRPRVTVTATADSHFLIDGKEATSEFWKKGEVLDVHDGMLVAQLNASAEANIDGTASLRLLNNKGDLELRRGKAYFRSATEGPDFEVQVAGATVRHVGTDFGIRAKDDGSCDVHVMGGSVEISRPGQETLVLVAGESVSWRDGGPSKRAASEPRAFRMTPPIERVIFDDDFSEPVGTVLANKMPDEGKPWKVVEQQGVMTTGGNRLDTSGGFRHLGAVFADVPAGAGRDVVVATFTTTPPSVMGDKKTRRSGIERITLLDAEGKRLCSVVALAREEHCWRLRDDVAGRESSLTNLSALDTHHLSLRYDPMAGRISLHAGLNAQGETIAELDTEAQGMPATLELWNDYGGDFALSRLTVRHVRYQ